ncbi:MAG TPA: TPM domain-containing protein [Polyangia bacterium]
MSFPRVLIASVVALGVIASASAGAETRSVPPTPATYVTDSGDFLSSAVRRELEERLAAYQAATGRQVVLWIGQRTDVRESIEDWAARAFSAWGVGTRGRDDGVIIFILPHERKLRIEVGYGLEGALPDARASQIVRDRISPSLAKGDRDGAARAGVSAVLGALGGEPPGAAPPESDVPRRISWLEGVVFAIGIFVLIVLFVTHPRLALSLLFAMVSGGRGPEGGGGHRRGGFSGGGGRSGGGGASGSW